MHKQRGQVEGVDGDEINANHRQHREQHREIQYHEQNPLDNNNNNNESSASLPGKQQTSGKQHVAATPTASQFVRRQSIRRKKPTTSCARLGGAGANANANANQHATSLGGSANVTSQAPHQKPSEIDANSNEIISHNEKLTTTTTTTTTLIKQQLEQKPQVINISSKISDANNNKSNSTTSHLLPPKLKQKVLQAKAINENQPHLNQSSKQKSHQHQQQNQQQQQQQQQNQRQPKQQVASRLSLLLFGLFDRGNKHQNQNKSQPSSNDNDNVKSDAHRRQQQQQQQSERSASSQTKSSAGITNGNKNSNTIRNLLNIHHHQQNDNNNNNNNNNSHSSDSNNQHRQKAAPEAAHLKQQPAIATVRRKSRPPTGKALPLSPLRQLTAPVMLLGLGCLCLASLSANLLLLTSGQQVVNPNKLLTSRHNKLAAANRGLDAAAASLAGGSSSSLTAPTTSSSLSSSSSSSSSSSIPGSKEGKLLVCYYTNWSQYRPKEGKYVPEDIDPHLCTHVIVAFGWMKKNKLAPFDASDESKDGKKGLFERVTSLKLANPALKVLVAVGGWSFGTERFKTMAANRYNRQLFIFSALEFLRERNFDGLDIDWEFPQASDKKNFVDLLKELREAFDAEAKEKRLPKLMLTVAVSAGAETVRAGYDVAAIGAHVDFINIMSYDFHGKWESKTGHNAPLFASSSESEWRKMLSMDYGVKLWERMGAPKAKLVVGLATYGRSFTLASTGQTGMNAPTSGGGKAGEFTREGGFLAFYEICDMLKQGASYYWDEEQAVPYAVQGDQWVGFDDELSIRNKVKWLNDQGYAGAMVWALDMDDFKGICTPKKYPLIRAMAEGLFNLPVRPSQEWRVIIEGARTRANVAAGTSLAGKVVPGGTSTAAALAAANSILSSAGITNPATADAIRSVIVALGPTALTAGSQPNADLAGHLKNIPGLNVTSLLSSPSALAALTAANPQLAAQIALAAAAAASQTTNNQQQLSSASNINLGQATNLNNNRSLDSTNARIVCYYTNWSYKRPGSGRFGPENLDPNLCTHIIYAFYGLKDSKLVPTEEIDSSDNDQAPYKRLIALKQLNPNLKVMLAVGGWMMGYAPFRQLTENAYRQTFFTFEVIEFLRKKNFDGLDLCWEFPRGLDDKEKFSNLVKELRESFDGEAKSSGKPRLILSAAVPASFEAISAGYDVPTINKYLDFMNVMTYDFHGDWEQVVGHNSPLYPLNSATAYQKKLTLDFSAAEWVRQGASKENLVIGLPTYGRTFTLANPNLTDIDAPAARGGKPGQYTKESGFLSFFEVCEMLKNQATLVWDNEQMIPYAYKADQWVGFDDPRSFKMKVQWLKQNGYSGIMIWSVDMDDFAGSCMGLRYPLIKSAKEELKGYYVPNLVESAQGSTVHASIGAKDELQCEETDGHITYHKDKKDCTMYYMCEGSRKHHMPCPQNLVFNQNENVCDWPENVEGCGTKVATETSAAPAG